MAGGHTNCAAAVCARAQAGKPSGEYHTVSLASFMKMDTDHPDQLQNRQNRLSARRGQQMKPPPEAIPWECKIGEKKKQIFPPKFEDKLLYCKGRRPILTEESRKNAETKLKKQKAEKKQAAAAEQPVDAEREATQQAAAEKIKRDNFGTRFAAAAHPEQATMEQTAAAQRAAMEQKATEQAAAAEQAAAEQAAAKKTAAEQAAAEQSAAERAAAEQAAAKKTAAEQAAAKKTAAEQAAAEQSIKRRVKERIFAEKETERQSNGDSNPENCFNALCERMGDENITNGYFQKNRNKVVECESVGALGKFAEMKCPAARLADDFFNLLLLDVKQ